MVKIKVPVHSQNDNEIKNDCGVVAAQMLIHGYTGQLVSVESYYKELGLIPGQFQQVTNIIKFLANHGVTCFRDVSMSTYQLIQLLDYGRPVIALISYKELVKAGLACYTGDFNHFVVVVGYDTGNIIIHDPYCPRESGAFRYIPTETFELAWSNLDTPRIGIVPTYGMGLPPAGTHIVRVASALNVREGPGTNYSVVGFLYNGQYVTVHEEKHSWGRVGDNKWVYMTFLDKISGTEPDVVNPTPSAEPSIEDISILVTVPRGVKVVVKET